MEGILKKELTELCRICLKASYFKMKSLLDPKNAKIVEEIEFCTGVTFKYEANEPFQICSECLYSLSIAHDFKKTCIKSEEIIRDNLTVKVEPNDFDNPIDLDALSDPDEELIKYEPSSFGLENDCDINGPDNFKPDSNLQCIKENNKKVKVRRKTKKNARRKEPKSIKPKKNKLQKLSCDSCNIKFGTTEESEAHKTKFHTKDLGGICEVCGKILGYRASMAMHLRSHMPPKFSCESCNYDTINKHDLAKHMMVHTGHKPYECLLCDRAYCTKSNLRQHMRRRHEGGETRRYACNRDACGKTFVTKSKLSRHLDTHDNIKRHACTVCESAFTRRCYLKKHLEKNHNIMIPRLRPGRQKEVATIMARNQYEIT